MSKTAYAFMIKLVMTIAMAGVTFAMFQGNSWGVILLLGVLGATLNYILGDLVILPWFGNTVAAIGDGLLAAVTAFMLDLLVPAFTTSFSPLAMFAMLIAIGEYFFHLFLLRTPRVAP